MSGTGSLLKVLDSDHPSLASGNDLFSGDSRKPLGGINWLEVGDLRIPQVVNEFWTAGQRQASSLHEISYRACFKPQLPAYFIRRFSNEGDIVYDPFSGRGTTALEAALLGRKFIANDVNPLLEILARPRIEVPEIAEVSSRLETIPYHKKCSADIDISMFYSPDTEAEIVSLRNYLRHRRDDGEEDSVDRWIRMVATNRLTGHSSGFFSVYTFPPNQAVSQESQRKINERRKRKPEYCDTKKIILKKTRSLLKKVTPNDRRKLDSAARSAVFLNCDARFTREIKDETVQLTVTSPPFLDIVQYSEDNWLRCWFNCISLDSVGQRITMSRTIEQWVDVMGSVFLELFRITKPGGFVAFEVGELQGGKIKLDEHVAPLGAQAGFVCEAILLNKQEFTKTSNIWGVKNNQRGTNTNRIVLFRRD